VDAAFCFADPRREGDHANAKAFGDQDNAAGDRIGRPYGNSRGSDPDAAPGAGDAYRAGFVAGYIKFGLKRGGLKGVTPDDLLVCGQMGSVAAVYTVEKYGTQTHTFTRVEFAKRYRENFGSLLSF